MKKIILVVCIIAIALIAMLAFRGVPQAKATDAKPSANPGNQVIAYYFHGLSSIQKRL